MTRVLTPFFSLLQSLALLTFQQLSLSAPSGFGGKERGLLASGGSGWPALRRLKNDAGAGLEVEAESLVVLIVFGCLFCEPSAVCAGRFDM